jgi:hypothetical protein
LHAEDQHVLGKPALIVRHHRGDAQRKALLAEQGIAAVAGAERPDLARFRKMNDPLLFFVARPGHVLRARRERRAHRMHAWHELAVFTEPLRHGAADARHDAHVHRDVRGVR